MNVQVNTGHNIEGGEELNNFIESSLKEDFGRFRNAITRIEVHLNDENGKKSGSEDKRCLLEARIANHQPMVASHHAETIHQAFTGASDKLLRLLDSMVDKLTDRTSPKSMVPEESSTEDNSLEDT